MKRITVFLVCLFLGVAALTQGAAPGIGMARHHPPGYYYQGRHYPYRANNYFWHGHYYAYRANNYFWHGRYYPYRPHYRFSQGRYYPL